MQAYSKAVEDEEFVLAPIDGEQLVQEIATSLAALLASKVTALKVGPRCACSSLFYIYLPLEIECH